MENLPNLGFDLDGVLYPWVTAVYTYQKMYFNYTGDEYTFYKNINTILSKEDQDYIVTIPFLYANCVPDKELVNFLSDVSKKFNIFYITARPESVRRVTEKYLRDFNFPQDHNLIFSSNKDTLARLLKLDYFVEDSVANAEKLNKICTTFLVKTPYNEDYTGEVPMINSIYNLRGVLL